LGEPPPKIIAALLPPPRLAAKTIAAVSLTSRETSIRGPRSRSASSATFIPIEESPGEET
jgi:hypothetical protein